MILAAVVISIMGVAIIWLAVDLEEANEAHARANRLGNESERMYMAEASKVYHLHGELEVTKALLRNADTKYQDAHERLKALVKNTTSKADYDEVCEANLRAAVLLAAKDRVIGARDALINHLQSRLLEEATARGKEAKNSRNLKRFEVKLTGRRGGKSRKK